MTDEPMVERLAEECIASSVTLECEGPDVIAALLSQLREQRDRTSFWETLHDERVESLEAERDTWRQRAEEAEECIVWVKCDDPEHERLAAAERTVREQREVIEAAMKDHARFHSYVGNEDGVLIPVPCTICIAARASLPPNTEEDGT